MINYILMHLYIDYITRIPTLINENIIYLLVEEVIKFVCVGERVILSKK